MAATDPVESTAIVWSLIVFFVLAVVLCLVVFGLLYRNNRKKELMSPNVSPQIRFLKADSDLARSTVEFVTPQVQPGHSWSSDGTPFGSISIELREKAGEIE